MKALREAIDQRSAQVAKRTGTTAAMQEEGDRCVQLGRVIDTLVRPVIKTDPELLAAWENLLILPSPRRLRDAWRVTRGAWRDSSGAPRTFAMQRLPS